MAKSLVVLFAVFVGVNFSADLAKGEDLAGGQIGNYFLRGGLPGGGLGNELVDGLTGGVNNLLCTLVGPDFLRVVLTKNRCPSGVILPNLFKSYKCYCHFYNRQPPNIKKCLSDAAARVDIGLDGIIKLDLLLGICCKNCNTKNFQQNRMIGGQLGHDLFRIGVSNAGLVGGLVGGLFHTSNQLVCTLLGHNFLRLLLDECKNCAGGDLLPTTFKSYSDFCAFFNRLPPNRQKCVTHSAVLISGPSIFRIDLLIGQCCAQCTQTGKNLPQSPPSCKRTNGNNLDRCKKGC